MKQGKVVVLPMIIVAVLLIVSFVVGLFIFKPNDESKSIFDYFTVGQILDDGYRTAIDDSFKFTRIKEYGYIGDGQIDVLENEICSIWFVTNLSKDISKDNVESLVSKFITDFSKSNQLSIIEEPIKLQYCDEENFKNRPEDDYIALSEGYILFEYSYRDKDGVLWIVQVFSPQEDYLSGLIVKQINEEEFEGYEPQVDMRKEK